MRPQPGTDTSSGTRARSSGPLIPSPECHIGHLPRGAPKHSWRVAQPRSSTKFKTRCLCCNETTMTVLYTFTRCVSFLWENQCYGRQLQSSASTAASSIMAERVRRRTVPLRKPLWLDDPFWDRSETKQALHAAAQPKEDAPGLPSKLQNRSPRMRVKGAAPMQDRSATATPRAWCSHQDSAALHSTRLRAYHTQEYHHVVQFSDPPLVCCWTVRRNTLPTRSLAGLDHISTLMCWNSLRGSTSYVCARRRGGKHACVPHLPSRGRGRSLREWAFRLGCP